MQMASGGIHSNSMELITHTILQEDHTISDVANQKYWKTFLGIDDQTNDYIYVVLFYNVNYTNSYKVNLIIYLGEHKCDLYRNDYIGNPTYGINSEGTQYYLFATSGTEITVCRMKKL